MPKPKHWVLNAFDMNCAGHINHGLWSHPRDRSAEFSSLDYWIDVAKAAERGLFDAIFIADIAGIYEVYEGGPDAAMRHGVQVPVNDPMLIVPTMAHATKHIGFGVTVNTRACCYRTSGLILTLGTHCPGCKDPAAAQQTMRNSWRDGVGREDRQGTLPSRSIH